MNRVTFVSTHVEPLDCITPWSIPHMMSGEFANVFKARDSLPCFQVEDCRLDDSLPLAKSAWHTSPSASRTPQL